MAEYVVTIHHKNCTGTGRGWNMTVAGTAAVASWCRHNDADAIDVDKCVQAFRALRSAKQGFAGLVHMKSYFEKNSFVKVERF